MQPGTGRFVHALARETLYADLLAGQRARRHAAVAHALAERLPRQDDLVSEVAHHFSRAAVYQPDLLDAGRRAHQRRSALGGTTRRLRGGRASCGARRSTSTSRAAPATTERRHDLLLGLAWLLMRLGDMRRHAVAPGRGAGRTPAPRVTTCGWPRRRPASAAPASGTGDEVGSDDPDTVAVLEECLAHVEDLGLRARLLANLGLEHYVAWRPELSDPPLWESLEVARRSGDIEVLRDCLAAREMTLWAPGAYRAARGVRPRAPDSAAVAASSRSRRASSWPARQHQDGDAHAADETMAGAFALAEELGRTGLDVPLAFWRWLRADERQSPEADRLAEVAIALHRRSSIVSAPEIRGCTRLAVLRRTARCPTTSSSGRPATPTWASVQRSPTPSPITGDRDRALEVLGPPEPLGTDYTALFGGCLHGGDPRAGRGSPGRPLRAGRGADQPARRPGRDLRHGAGRWARPPTSWAADWWRWAAPRRRVAMLEQRPWPTTSRPGACRGERMARRRLAEATA